MHVEHGELDLNAFLMYAVRKETEFKGLRRDGSTLITAMNKANFRSRDSNGQDGARHRHIMWSRSLELI